MENANLLWEGGPENSAPHGLVERRDLVDPAAHRCMVPNQIAWCRRVRARVTIDHF
jgi:hypothetical protein